MATEAGANVSDLLRTCDFDPAAVRRAMERVRTAHYEPTIPEAISPAAHDAVNELLGRAHGTPVTPACFVAAQQALYDRCTPEEREQLVAMVFGAYQPT